MGEYRWVENSHPYLWKLLKKEEEEEEEEEAFIAIFTVFTSKAPMRPKDSLIM